MEDERIKIWRVKNVKNKNIECEKYEKIKISRATNTKEKKYGG
jgi:hypothetical protein